MFLLLYKFQSSCGLKIIVIFLLKRKNKFVTKSYNSKQEVSLDIFILLYLYFQYMIYQLIPPKVTQ